MSLLTICNKLAENVGMDTTEQVLSSPRREWKEAASFSNEVGAELARRVDCGALSMTLNLVAVSNKAVFELGEDFSRIASGIGVTHHGNIVRPLTWAEWASLSIAVGDPRYFMLKGRDLYLWPSLAIGDAVSIRYQSRNWCSNGKAEWTADSNTALIDEGLMAKGLIVRWRRQKGMPFEDFEAEYEAELADIARFDDRARF